MSREMSNPEQKVLRALASEPELWWGSIELARVAGLPTGTTTAPLARLENKRYAVSEWRYRDDFATGKRRLYRITPAGLAFFQSQ